MVARAPSRTAVAARRASWKLVAALVVLLLVVAGVALWLGLAALRSHQVVTSTYTKPAAHTVAVSAAPSSGAGTLGVITVVSGAISALTGAGGLVYAVVKKREPARN